ncbi:MULTISPECIES: hemerythrin domain-containing protein [Aliagarivorans]|uniref:hemerythrin domain-containing protein n=1 Tax=Aliagarivorans TaxID=882379 RepID=UPI000403A587|nr:MULTISPECIES: hemerythrin domain-containing protein [Aliagarivorans]
MIKSLQQDHQNIAKLLKVLEHKLELIRSEKAVKYKLLDDIVTYLHDYADKFHHPKEDMIYDYYVKYRVVEDDLSGKLKVQHEELKELTEELQGALELILLDAVVPLDQFSDRLEAYIQAQWEHLNYEEEVVFPALLRHLTADDWRAIEQGWEHGRGGDEDPLFGHQVKEQYHALAERIRLSESAS